MIAGRQVSSVASDSVISTAGGTSGLVLYPDSALACAPSVLAIGAQSVADVAGNKLMLGLPVDFQSMYSSLISVCKSQVQLYIDSIDWLKTVPPTAFSSVDFKFRTTEQYGTAVDSGIAGGVFSVYAPSWAVMADAGRNSLAGCTTQRWDEGYDDSGECPWPGKKAMEQQSYRSYKEMNVAANGLEEVTGGEAGLTSEPFSSYHIRRQL